MDQNNNPTGSIHNFEKPTHHKRVVVWVVVAAVVLASMFVIIVALVTNPNPQTGGQPAGLADADQRLKGVSMTPRTQDAAGFNEVYRAADELGNALTWSGDWAELGRSQSGAKTLLNSTRQHSYTPIILVSLHNNREPATLLRPLTPGLINQYAADAAKFAQSNNIKYMGLGIEINNLARSDPQGYQSFVELFNRAYDSIKQVSPGTKVFTIFQLERTKGLNGGLFGGVNNPSDNTWSLLNDFGKADMVGFTTYPGLIYKTPAEVPADYYSEIAAHTTKPVVFTEIGWPASTEAKGWGSSPEQQAEFISRFFELTNSLRPGIVVWSFAFDPPVGPPFSSLGLADKAGGVHRPAWDRWKMVDLK